MDVRSSPPTALDNNPCSDHGHQGVECVDVAGGDSDGQAEKKSCTLLHRWTWSDRKIAEWKPPTSVYHGAGKVPDTAGKI